MPGTILLVDGEQLTRYALASFIGTVSPYRVTAHCDSGEAALELLTKPSPGVTPHPQYLLTEITLPAMSGIELIRELGRRKIPIIPIVLTRLCAASILQQSFSAGAVAFLSKSTSAEDLAKALDYAGQGRRYVSSDLAELEAHSQEERYVSNDPLGALSPREREIFHLLAGGITNMEIAKQLFISPRTVETHRARLVRKLGLATNAELIRFAIRNGLSVA